MRSGVGKAKTSLFLSKSQSAAAQSEKVPHRQLFSRKGTEPVNNTRYTLDIVVCGYYERDQRFKRFLVKNANARRTGKAYPKPFVGCKRGFNGGIIAFKVKIIDKKLCFALGARSDNERIAGLHNKHGASANYAGERKGKLRHRADRIRQTNPPACARGF